MDVYFSADIETDGPIPGPYSMLSFAIVYAGSFDGQEFVRPRQFDTLFYSELKPISEDFEQEALDVNGLDRDRLKLSGGSPTIIMTDAAKWIKSVAGDANPVLVAYPLSFDWTWLYWYFVRFSDVGSPFKYSSCFDIKTAISTKLHIPISASGRKNIPAQFTSTRKNTHNAADDAIAQAEIFANVFEWNGSQ